MKVYFFNQVTEAYSTGLGKACTLFPVLLSLCHPHCHGRRPAQCQLLDIELVEERPLAAPPHSKHFGPQARQSQQE